MRSSDITSESESEAVCGGMERSVMKANVG